MPAIIPVVLGVVALSAYLSGCGKKDEELIDSDAGTPDAELPDADPVDAGQIDAGTPDTGVDQCSISKNQSLRDTDRNGIADQCECTEKQWSSFNRNRVAFGEAAPTIDLGVTSVNGSTRMFATRNPPAGNVSLFDPDQGTIIQVSSQSVSDTPLEPFRQAISLRQTVDFGDGRGSTFWGPLRPLPIRMVPDPSTNAMRCESGDERLGMTMFSFLNRSGIRDFTLPLCHQIGSPGHMVTTPLNDIAAVQVVGGKIFLAIVSANNQGEVVAGALLAGQPDSDGRLYLEREQSQTIFLARPTAMGVLPDDKLVVLTVSSTEAAALSVFDVSGFAPQKVRTVPLEGTGGAHLFSLFNQSTGETEEIRIPRVAISGSGEACIARHGAGRPYVQCVDAGTLTSTRAPVKVATIPLPLSIRGIPTGIDIFASAAGEMPVITIDTGERTASGYAVFALPHAATSTVSRDYCAGYVGDHPRSLFVYGDEVYIGTTGISEPSNDAISPCTPQNSPRVTMMHAINFNDCAIR
ncbi:MAG: hypothetical protein HY540_06965 [Deltaproteobacteria bacterium]|nr:hypothetical protein [Deltaproteobacteria bacterium]